MAGRKSKYTPQTVAKIVQAIELGATYALAAGYAGITFETLNVWRKTKSGFSEALQEAEGKAAITWLAKIEREASNGDWRAAAWKLERRYPQDYGKTVQEQHVTGDPDKPIGVRLVRQ
jgi:transposase